MSGAPENRLKNSASPYLRSAAHQPVDWHEWGEEAFAKARAAGKPVLLDIGAVWCHWCHVIDRESYENPEIAAMINELYIPVKVDRDERPDVDARYQSAISAISGQGGWPLTAFLTPDGKPFFGGTYFPPKTRWAGPDSSASSPRSPMPSRSAAPKWITPRRRSNRRWRRPRFFRRARRIRCAGGRRGGRSGGAAIRSHARRIRRRAEIPALLGDRSAARAREMARRRESARDRRGDAQRHGRRRLRRSDRRRIPSLLGGRALVRAALRKNVVRQFGAAEELSPRLPGDRQCRFIAKSRRD